MLGFGPIESGARFHYPQVVISEVEISASTDDAIFSGSASVTTSAPFTQEQLDYILAYVLENIMVPTANENAAAVIAALNATTIPVDVQSMTGIIEADKSAEQMLRIMFAALVGRTTGVGTSTEQYLSQAADKARIEVSFDGDNNRTTVALDGS